MAQQLGILSCSLHRIQVHVSAPHSGSEPSVTTPHPSSSESDTVIWPSAIRHARSTRTYIQANHSNMLNKVNKCFLLKELFNPELSY